MELSKTNIQMDYDDVTGVVHVYDPVPSNDSPRILLTHYVKPFMDKKKAFMRTFLDRKDEIHKRLKALDTPDA